ncbi:putative deoxyribonuclease TATDN1 [Scaptodrosophila lebanonensis]|uniref:Deoxyribonuclease TATDN1 n=1 Tax=Drosophila lebanonensis TaxID=7225 RepID=A0A6J2UGI9_DROLE|nr:putative deoxyribonuclease TATDN1 [Scaptodrosophila lebanonensis]
MRRTANNFKMALKYIDIGANLTDPMFRGQYGGSKKHQPDLEIVLQRAWQQGMQKIIVTSGSLSDVDEALDLVAHDERLYTTVGCHPTRCDEFVADPELYYNELRARIAGNTEKVVAVGECGLDFDRLNFCGKETQMFYFEKQIKFAADFGLPLFLHMRNAYTEFMEILERNRQKLQACGGGVVHSFTGTSSEAKGILEFGGLYIGVNGCSLKTEENVKVVRELPNERILLETDCPWCGIRPSHASHKYVATMFPTVKKKEKWTADTLIDGRCEPCQISQVLEAVAGIKREPIDKLADIYYQNTLNLFFSRKQSSQ